ncbi:Vi polysaccharide biosynthesis protein VipB/TviC [Acidobacteria bacterium Mor1]|nr:Vi polysaccharide biosynthesis protein VipB/TviC [Acidobacteria bacterium Mor1]
MAKYLVTGGGGFIGSHLTQTLLGDGQDVRVLDDFSTGRRENLTDVESWASDGGGSFELMEGDIRDRDVCQQAMQGVDYVLHQAAIPSVPRSVRDPLSSHEVNVNGTLNLLLAAREVGVKRFVAASSSSVYGANPTLPKVETLATDPISPYALQKLAAERYCMLFHQLYGVPTVALRYFNVFGPRQDPNSEYAAVIPKFLTCVAREQKPTIYGDGEQSRDFTYIANVVQMNLKSCHAGPEALGKPYNVGCGDRISLNDLMRNIGKLVGREVSAEYTEARAGDVKHSLADIGQARELVGFDPQIDLLEGLDRTWQAIDRG